LGRSCSLSESWVVVCGQCWVEAWVFFLLFSVVLGWGDMGPFVVPGLLVVVVAGSAFKLIARKGTGEKAEDSKSGAQESQTKSKYKPQSQSQSKHKSDNFKFTKGRVKGQIVRQKCDFIYISIWDADLHDFVNPSDAKQC
jgi:hypothetical protein